MATPNPPKAALPPPDGPSWPRRTTRRQAHHPGAPEATAPRGTPSAAKKGKLSSSLGQDRSGRTARAGRCHHGVWTHRGPPGVGPGGPFSKCRGGWAEARPAITAPASRRAPSPATQEGRGRGGPAHPAEPSRSRAASPEVPPRLRPGGYITPRVMFSEAEARGLRDVHSDRQLRFHPQLQAP